MKAWLVVVVSLALGAASGVGATWATFAHSGPVPTVELAGGLTPPPADGPQPVADVAHTEFDFGTLERDISATHSFPIANRGAYPLEIKLSGTSCGRCTFAHVEQNRLLPGESTEMVAEYRSIMGDGSFSKTILFTTNDPKRPRVELFISGSVAQSYELSPKELSFGSVSAHDPHTAEATIYSLQNNGLEILDHSFANEEIAGYFKVETAPLTADQLEFPGAQSGHRIRVIVRPGLAFGSYTQQVRLTTNLAKNPIVELPINLNITSDISITGGNWQSDKGVLTIGAVSQGTSAKRALTLIARGPHRRDVHFQVQSAQPEWLKITFGEPRELSSGASVQVPMEIEIPADAPRVNYMGASRDSWSKITLDTGDPDSPQMHILLRFAVER